MVVEPGGGVVGPPIVQGGEVFHTDTLGTHLLVEGSLLITAVVINPDLLVGANGGGRDEGDVGCMTRGCLAGPINEGAVCVTVGDKVCIGGEIWVRGAGGAVNDKGVMGSYSGGLHQVVILPGWNVVRGGNAHCGANVFRNELPWREVPLGNEGAHPDAANINESGSSLSVARSVVCCTTGGVGCRYNSRIFYCIFSWYFHVCVCQGLSAVTLCMFIDAVAA